MDVEQPRDVLHRIVPVNLYEPRIGMSRAHRLTPDRLRSSTAAGDRCALPPIGPARSAHRLDNGPPCGTPAPRITASLGSHCREHGKPYRSVIYAAASERRRKCRPYPADFKSLCIEGPLHRLLDVPGNRSKAGAVQAVA